MKVVWQKLHVDSVSLHEQISPNASSLGFSCSRHAHAALLQQPASAPSCCEQHVRPTFSCWLTWKKPLWMWDASRCQERRRVFGLACFGCYATATSHQSQKKVPKSQCTSHGPRSPWQPYFLPCDELTRWPNRRSQLTMMMMNDYLKKPRWDSSCSGP